VTIWSRLPDINITIETIKKIIEENKGKIDQIDETTLLHRLSKEEKQISQTDLTKILLTLETLGYISVQLSTKEEKIIKLLKKETR